MPLISPQADLSQMLMESCAKRDSERVPSPRSAWHSQLSLLSCLLLAQLAFTKPADKHLESLLSASKNEPKTEGRLLCCFWGKRSSAAGRAEPAVWISCVAAHQPACTSIRWFLKPVIWRHDGEDECQHPSLPFLAVLFGSSLFKLLFLLADKFHDTVSAPKSIPSLVSTLMQLLSRGLLWMFIFQTHSGTSQLSMSSSGNHDEADRLVFNGNITAGEKQTSRLTEQWPLVWDSCVWKGRSSPQLNRWMW